MKLFFILLSLCISIPSFSQSKGNIKGVVQSADSTFLEKATVSIIDAQDSSVISYSLTDNNGKFEFTRMPQHQELVLFISHINASPYQQSFVIRDDKTLDFGTIGLAGQSLEEIIITAAPPVRMNNDTLEYNADYFKTRPNANVEELLRELPGLQVNMDGTIYYQGKEVSQVKVNGKDFFTTDTRIATRNLDANLIKTVQVYREKGQSKRNIDDEENLPVTINLKFKNDLLRADFGKAYASGGSRERYEAGALFNTFRDTTQISFIAYSNNINRESFDYNELNQYAGLGRAENHGFNDFGGRNFWGIGNDIAGGVNINHDWGNENTRGTKVNLMYMYRHKKHENSNDGNNIFRFEDQEQYSDYMYGNITRSNNHDIRSFLRHRLDTTAYVEFVPQIIFGNNDNLNNSSSNSRNDNVALSSDISSNTDDQSDIRYDHRLYVEKQLSKEHVVSFTNTISRNQLKSEAISENVTEMFQTENPYIQLWNNTIRNTITNNQHWSAAYYNKMFTKLTFDLYFTINQGSESPIETFYFDRNNGGVIHGKNYENSYKFQSRDYISGVKFSWKPAQRLIFNFGTAFQIKETDFDFMSIRSQRNIRENHWLPNFNIRYKDLEIGWARDIRNPQLYGIQTQANDLNPMFKRLPSTDFDNVLSEVSFINYSRNTVKYQTGGRLSFTHLSGSIGTRRWNDVNTGEGILQSYQAKATKSLNANAYFRYNFKFGKDWQHYISLNTRMYNYENYQTINDIENKSNMTQWFVGPELSVRWKNLIGIAPKYSLNIQNSNNSVKDNSDFAQRKYLSHDYGVGLNINPIKGFSLESVYTLQNRPNGINSRANFNILNASLYYTMKNNSQLKISAFDILNQNVQNFWGMQGNSEYYMNTVTLRQYFLLGYVHKFNLVKTK